MAGSQFKVSIITPDGTVYQSDKANMLVINTEGGGQIGIMANHIPVIAALAINVMKIKHDGADDDFVAVNGGFVEFQNNEATVVADSAELPTMIDVERAQKAKERSQQWVTQAKQSNNKDELSRAEVHLKRAINRLNVANMK